MVQMLEAFCLAPFVGAVIDFSGSVLSVKISVQPNINFCESKITRKFSKIVHLMKRRMFYMVKSDLKFSI